MAPIGSLFLFGESRPASERQRTGGQGIENDREETHMMMMVVRCVSRTQLYARHIARAVPSDWITR